MTDLDAIRARDAAWTDVADDPNLTPLHLDTHEGATHLERRSCAKAAIVDRRALLAALDQVSIEADVADKMWQAAEEREARLRSFAEEVAESKNDTPGTRAMARYALTGSLEGVVDEMRRGTDAD